MWAHADGGESEVGVSEGEQNKQCSRKEGGGRRASG